jgi:hypothetical protein
MMAFFADGGGSRKARPLGSAGPRRDGVAKDGHRWHDSGSPFPIEFCEQIAKREGKAGEDGATIKRV